MELQDLIDEIELSKASALQNKRNKHILITHLEKFLLNTSIFVDKSLEIICVQRYGSWCMSLWHCIGIFPEVTQRLYHKYGKAIIGNATKQTITWKLKYYILTAVYLSKHSPDSLQYHLDMIIAGLKSAIQVPVQMAYFQALLLLFDEHRLENQEYILETVHTQFLDVNYTNIIEPELQQSLVDVHMRSVLNIINRQHHRPSVNIYSILCHQAHLNYKRLISPLANSELWADFNLKDKTLTINCQMSCLRNERPDSETEDYETQTTEILTINFDSITKITEKYWGSQPSHRGTLLIFTLNKPCHYMYASSRESVLSGNTLFLNIKEGEELYKLLDTLAEIFTIQFQRLRRNQQRQVLVSQQGTSDSDSDWLPNPATGRAAARSSLSFFGRRQLQENSQVSVAYKEKLSLRRSGSTVSRVHQIQTQIHTPVVLNDRRNSFGSELNSDNWTVSDTFNNRILPANPQNPNRSQLSLRTVNDKDETMSQNSTSKDTFAEKLNKTIDKHNPTPYRIEPATSVHDSDSCTSNKENQPENISQGRPSTSQKKSRKAQEQIIETIDLISSSDSDIATNKGNNNDRLKDIIVHSDNDNECDNSDILAGNLRNRLKFKRSLLRRSALQQESQDSAMDFQQHIIPSNRHSTERPAEQSQVSQDTVSSGAEFQPRIPRSTSNNPECQPENMATAQEQNSPIDLTADSLSVESESRLAKRSRPNENSENEGPNLDNSSQSLPLTDTSENHELNITADIILESVLGNTELPVYQELNIAVTATSQASDSDVISASTQNGRTPEQPAQTQDIVTSVSEISIRSARSCVSVTSSSQTNEPDISNTTTENRLEQFIRQLDSEVDKIRYDYPTPPSNIGNEDELVIDLSHDADNQNDEHGRDETINTTVDVQPLNNLLTLDETITTVRRKRSRAKQSDASVGNDTVNTTACSTTSSKRRKREKKCKQSDALDGNDTVNTTAYSTTSSKRRRHHREKKCKKHCDCDAHYIDTDLSFSRRRAHANLKDVQKEEEERKRLLRFTTTFRLTKPPVRLVDELNESFLDKINGEIERKREMGYCTDTVVYRKSLNRRSSRRHTDADPQRLSQTLDALDITETGNDTVFESAVPERGTQSDVEHEGRHKKKNKKNKKSKKSKRPRAEYDSSLIEDMSSSIRMRLSRRHDVTIDLLTQESMTQDDVTLPCTQSQESQGWGAVFNKSKTNPNNANITDESNWKRFHYVRNYLNEIDQNADKIMKELVESGHEERKATVKLLSKQINIHAEKITKKLKEQYADLLEDD